MEPVSINMFSGDHGTFRRSELTSLARASVKIWGATRVPLGGNRDPGARRPPCLLTSLLPIQWQQWSRSSAFLYVPANYTSCGFRRFRHISDICPWQIALISTLPGEKQLNFLIIRRILVVQLLILDLHPAFTQPLVLIQYTLHLAI